LNPGGCCYITTPNIYSFHGLLGGPALTLLKNRKLGYLGYENCYSPGFLANLMEKSGFVDIEYGVLQTGELFGTFYQLIPFLGAPFYRFLRKASYFLESRQSVFGFMSYSIGYRRK